MYILKAWWSSSTFVVASAAPWAEYENILYEARPQAYLGR